tara:strand:+ start:1343 stop:1831 length:489 start_codon:yes stop_codon:yes gene_type:complete
MKARQLSKLVEAIVRKVIREELKPIILELNENKRPKTKKTIVKKAQKKVDPFDVSNVLNEHRVKSKPKMKFAKDSMINQLLTETYETDEWRSINGGSTFTSQNAQAFGYGSQTATPTPINMAPAVDPEGRPVDVNLEGTAVGAALTRDYSALMKKINSKKGA